MAGHLSQAGGQLRSASRNSQRRPSLSLCDDQFPCAFQYVLALTRYEFTRIIARVVTQHGHQHAEETVSNTTYSTSMTLPLSLEGGVDTREIGLALGHAMCHMIERIA